MTIKQGSANPGLICSSRRNLEKQRALTEKKNKKTIHLIGFNFRDEISDIRVQLSLLVV